MKRKIKFFDFDGTKLDSVCVDSEQSVKDAFARWRKKGLF